VRFSEALSEGDLAAARRCAAGCEYVLHGHTHRANDVSIAGLRIINPGALFRARPHTVATLDLARDAVAFWCVDENADENAGPQVFDLP
jgi:predicted phosphodiesterase